MRRIYFGTVALFVAGIVIETACTTYNGAPDAPDGSVADVEPDRGEVADAGDASVACDAKPYDQAGCSCAIPGALVACNQGIPGAKSACNLTGTQSCTIDKIWSACAGGGTPSAESCGNDIDDNCDGVVNEGCSCTSTVDLCRPDRDAGALTYNPDVYTLFTVPSSPKAGQAFDVFVVTKNQPLSTDLGFEQTSPTNFCYGAGQLRTCPSPGAGCGGWKVGWFQNITFTVAGLHTIRVLDPGQPGGCAGPPVATVDVVIAP